MLNTLMNFSKRQYIVGANKIMNKKIVLATNERGDCFKCQGSIQLIILLKDPISLFL